MGRFSDRHGYTSTEKAFQRESVDEQLRINLWNILKVCVWDRYDRDDYSRQEDVECIDGMVRRLWFNYFNNDMDNFPSFHDSYTTQGFYNFFKSHFLSCEWYEVYNFLEELACDRSKLITEETKEWINTSLVKHNAVYRLISNSFVEVTSKEEIIAIEGAINTDIQPVKEHLKTALRMLSDKENKDFRNSVKESISAVEAMSRKISGKKSATLADALKKVENCHPALASGFNRIYGYTSDESGIRHALSDQSEISYADAKFMLVACSAFISYLTDSADDT